MLVFETPREQEELNLAFCVHVFIFAIVCMFLLLLLEKEHLSISIRRFETYRVAIGFNTKLFLRKTKII